MQSKDINIKNRRATFDYAIGDTYTAGIVLTGTRSEEHTSELQSQR